MREVIGSLEKGELPLVKETTSRLRDVYDHTIQVIDTIETFRDMVSGMLDIYLSRRQQPVECGDEGIDHHRYHFLCHSPSLPESMA